MKSATRGVLHPKKLSGFFHPKSWLATASPLHQPFERLVARWACRCFHNRGYSLTQGCQGPFGYPCPFVHRIRDSYLGTRPFSRTQHLGAMVSFSCCCRLCGVRSLHPCFCVACFFNPVFGDVGLVAAVWEGRRGGPAVVHGLGSQHSGGRFPQNVAWPSLPATRARLVPTSQFGHSTIRGNTMQVTATLLMMFCP